MFIEPLFHKVINGGKTQTRRVVKQLNHTLDNPKYCEYVLTTLNPKYKLGEILYLKEPFVCYEETCQELKTNASGLKIAYKYGNNISIEDITGDDSAKWNNKLFMPESAARHFIQITGIRAERLQDISDEDCFREGIEESDCGGMKCVIFGVRSGLFFNELGSTPQEAYATLINKIAGRGTWDKNPWVWVFDFKCFNIK